ncbi:YigZ family protein [Clostridium sp. BJN0001]|uniref:YigZ family protein n=1 Tax=Clostridium sp. BJN0001 TaxID=2930219 RepID=UPI001FD34873|nr:YigZ family protein [Clostridium sp. BJN0001]
MAYITIKNYGEDRFIEKKSEFIGYAKRVENEDDAKKFINEIRLKHKDAKHNCYAYVIGQNFNIKRYSDDGEPKGTAGIPILEVLNKSMVTDCAIVVTRYFGGILLGTGGLNRAYTKGASIAIKNAGIVEKVIGFSTKYTFDYDILGKIQYMCTKNNWYIEDIIYTDKVTIEILIEKKMSESLDREIAEITNGKAVLEKGEEKFYFKEGYRLYSEL